jgi:anaerobic dimethyl sulfoxide reductase subunit B (iron-sulfur subunit)
MNMDKTMGFYIDLTRCIGCHTCSVACRDWNHLDDSASWREVLTIEAGEYPNPFVCFFPTACYHCSEPICQTVCPVAAIQKEESHGLIILDQEKCIGCGACANACPYQAPKLNHGKYGKCDMCLSRLNDGKQPICISSCPMRAIDYGRMEDLRTKYPGTDQVPYYPAPDATRPHLWIKAKLK